MATNILLDAQGRSSEERRALQDKIKRVNEIAAANWDDPTWRREMAQELTETIYLGFEHENLLSLMTTVENADFNARVFLKEVKGLRAFWVARGGYIEASSVKADILEIPRDTIGFHVYEFEDKLRTNFAETQATLVELGIQRLDAEVNLRMLKLFQAAVPSGSQYYMPVNGFNASGTAGLAVLNTALRQVRDESRDTDVAIVGRSLMTDQILDAITTNGTFGAFLPEANEDLLRRGVLGTYRGAKIIALKNFRDDTDTPFFPGNELWVIARDASKFAFWGGMLSKEYTEDDNWYWHYLARRDFGGVVHRANRLRRIVDTTIQPYVIVQE